MLNLSVCGLFLVLVLPANVAAQGEQPAQVPSHPFSPPTGQHAVGVHEFLWIDQNRGEPFTKDMEDRRHLLVRVWYPAERTPGSQTAPYISDAKEFAPDSIYQRAINVRTNSVTDAPLAKGRSRFPVLVYQPGGGTARFIATFETEQLASHGYVVVSADHPGFSETVLFPDGYHYHPDTLRAPALTGTLHDDALKNWDWLNQDVFPTWTSDASYVLDQLEKLDQTPGQVFYKRLDMSRVGMLGWSFGGATAVQMSKDDPRVKAVVDQDGQLFGDVREKGTTRPVMLMHHGNADKAPKPADDAALQELVAMVEGWNRSFLENSTNDRYEVTIAKTQHGSFSDFLLIDRPEPDELDPRRAHEIIIAYTLAFFDKYLRGRNSDLLKGLPRYREATFKKVPRRSANNLSSIR